MIIVIVVFIFLGFLVFFLSIMMRIILRMKIGIDTFGCDHARSGFGSYLNSCIANIPTDLLDNFELFGSELDRYTYSSDRPIKFNSVSVLDSLVIERFWHLFKRSVSDRNR